MADHPPSLERDGTNYPNTRAHRSVDFLAQSMRAGSPGAAPESASAADTGPTILSESGGTIERRPQASSSHLSGQSPTPLGPHRVHEEPRPNSVIVARSSQFLAPAVGDKAPRPPRANAASRPPYVLITGLIR